MMNNTIDLELFRSIVGYSPYSMHQLMKKSKVTRSFYRYWQGKTPMPLEVAIQLALTLEVPLTTFVSPKILWMLKQTYKR